MSNYTHKIENGQEVPLTDEEIFALEARDAAENERVLAEAEAAKYAAEPEYLDLSSISIGHAERLYAAAQAEAANTDVQGNPGDGPATVLLELLGL